MKILKVKNVLKKQKTTKIFVEKINDNIIDIAINNNSFKIKMLFPFNIVKINTFGSIEVDNENTIPILPNDFIIIIDEIYSKI